MINKNDENTFYAQTVSSITQNKRLVVFVYAMVLLSSCLFYRELKAGFGCEAGYQRCAKSCSQEADRAFVYSAPIERAQPLPQFIPLKPHGHIKKQASKKKKGKHAHKRESQKQVFDRLWTERMWEERLIVTEKTRVYKECLEGCLFHYHACCASQNPADCIR